jgi:diguanylate cyclase (GGDEF)-like protein
MSRLQDELIRSDRYNKTFSIAMVDIDKFKNANDTYGFRLGEKTVFYDFLRDYQKEKKYVYPKSAGQICGCALMGA